MKKKSLFVECGPRMLSQKFLDSLRDSFEILGSDLCDVDQKTFETMLEKADIIGLGGSSIVRLEKLEQIKAETGRFPKFIFIGNQWETYMENQATINFVKENNLLIPTLGGYFAVAQSVLRTALAGFLLRAKRLTQWNPDVVRKPLLQQKLSIIGLGRIGSILAGLAGEYFGSVAAFDPSLSAEEILKRLKTSLGENFSKGLSESSIESAMQADVVSVHLAYIPEVTDRIITREALNNLPKFSILINFSREQIIQEGLLLSFLLERKDVSYILDATTFEGKNFENKLCCGNSDSLYVLSNVVITQHTATGDDEIIKKAEYEQGFRKALESF